MASSRLNTAGAAVAEDDDNDDVDDDDELIYIYMGWINIKRVSVVVPLVYKNICTPLSLPIYKIKECWIPWILKYIQILDNALSFIN